MQELNRTINWKPEHTGTNRFGKWLENLQDWNLSRSRFWGIPLPIWRTRDGSEERIIGSIEELGEAIAHSNQALGKDQEVPADLHRPYIDDVVLATESGEPMYREPDLIDVWFDSGSMPYAQWHFPFENQEQFERNFPADFIAEGVDQTRGWFFTLHAIATMVFDKVAYKNVVSNGLVLDKNGQKMSKRLGNAVDPFETINAYGADATRWYMISNAQPWDNLKFDLDGLQEVRRKFFGTLYNTYTFYALYANTDGYDHSYPEVAVSDRPEIDRWVISLLNTLVEEVQRDYADYEPTNATRRIQAFVDEHLSNWYVRLNRRRFWKGELNDDKAAAYQTLYTCLTTVAKLMAPVAPFFGDWLYRNLNDVTRIEAHDSVHLALFPEVESDLIDKALEQRMSYAQRISSLVLSLRKAEDLRVRQPLGRILVPVLDAGFREQVAAVADVILQEVNVKELEYVDDTSGIIEKKAKPNFKTLGRRLGKHMKAAKAAIESLTTDDINTIEQSGSYTLTLDGADPIELTPDDLVIVTEDIPGWLVANDNELTVALDVKLTDSLRTEGLARELVSRLQRIRKEQGYEITDRIAVQLVRQEAMVPVVEQFGDYIRAEVLAEELGLVDSLESGQAVELVDGVTVEVLVGRS